MADTVYPPSARTAHRSPSALTTVVGAEGTRTVVVLRGEADSSTTAVLSDALSRVIASQGGDVGIDLAEAEFIDTATIRVLAVGLELLARQGRKLTVRSPSRLAARVLELFRLTDLIEARYAAQP